jgi:exopolyphosphatase / guanosine-5'-triphosphate,3'-diphosphate pyrophosphatase
MNLHHVTPKSDSPNVEKMASIDIGTNTILLLVAEVIQGRLRTLLDMETVVGLGRGLQRSGRLSPEAMNRGYETLNQYMERCRTMGVQNIYAVGTSALREAKNSEEFTGKVQEKLNLRVEIISGEEEARLSFLAVARDLGRSEERVLVVDVGGGSTEFVLGRGDQMTEWVSLPLGSVRFTEQYLFSDPVKEEEWEAMSKEIHRLLGAAPRSDRPLFMVAVGGTATTLASVDQGLKEFRVEKIHRYVLTKEALARQLSLYRSKTVDERKRIAGLVPNRADVVLAGGAILDAAMEEYRCSSASVSSQGIRYGLLYQRLDLERRQ